MIPEIRLLAAKTSRDNDNLWLPLLDHLKDTAGVIEYLASRWLPGSVYDEMEISRKEGIRLAKLLALLHDIGKGIPAFQTRTWEGVLPVAERLFSQFPKFVFCVPENFPIVF